ncbi:MAG TPA: SGNH/GDSL hydrolase family protein [Candidatus Acidoferrum sp.]|nr:SGNH/GDSL hydrolase family protein [Candidatus Acidoferrum sp.]
MNIQRCCALAFFLLLISSPPNAAQGKWVGTWATAPQAAPKGPAQTLHNQTLRLIVHTSVGGKKVRIKISNTFGDQPLLIGAARIARRASEANIDPATDRVLKFHGNASTTIPPRSMVVSDPADLDVPALSDLAISLFFSESAALTTLHLLAKQTNYLSPETGDATAQAKFPAAQAIPFWPFLTGVDVEASPHAATIVALGSSLTDGDGSTKDANRRWPDVLAERLQEDPGGNKELGVLNEGIIGNRLLSDTQSPRQAGGPPPLGPVWDQLGPALGQSGVARFDRDVIAQAGVKYVILALGVNDMLFPGAFIPQSETVTPQNLIKGNRQLIARAHKKGIRVIGTTIPPFEHAIFRNPFYDRFYSPENEKIRHEVNAWIRTSGEFDGIIDFDEAVRDPDHPTQILPAYDSGDHLHVNNAGNVAQGNVISLALFHSR